MAIDFLEMNAATDWQPLSVDQSNPEYRWHAGGSLAGAPVDVHKTFDGNMWTRTVLMDEFHLAGFRCRAGFVIPRHAHSEQKLIILFDGDCQLDFADSNGTERHETVSGLGAFFVVEADTPYTMTAGPGGVTYTETWDVGAANELATTWYSQGWVKK